MCDVTSSTVDLHEPFWRTMKVGVRKCWMMDSGDVNDGTSSSPRGTAGSILRIVSRSTVDFEANIFSLSKMHLST